VLGIIARTIRCVTVVAVRRQRRKS